MKSSISGIWHNMTLNMKNFQDSQCNEKLRFCDISDISNNDHCTSTVDITENEVFHDKNNIFRK